MQSDISCPNSLSEGSIDPPTWLNIVKLQYIVGLSKVRLPGWGTPCHLSDVTLDAVHVPNYNLNRYRRLRSFDLVARSKLVHRGQGVRRAWTAAQQGHYARILSVGNNRGSFPLLSYRNPELFTWTLTSSIPLMYMFRDSCAFLRDHSCLKERGHRGPRSRHIRCICDYPIV